MLPSTAKTRNENSENSGAQGLSESQPQPTTEKKSRSKTKSQASAAPLPTKHNDPRLRDKRTDEARRRLGITPEQMRGVPSISHLLGCADGGIEACIEALRLSDDADAVHFLERYDRVSRSDRGRLTIEEISISAGVPTKNLLAAALVAIEYVGKSAAAMATASFYAPVIKAVGQRAINGPMPTTNAKLFLSGVGFLPRPSNREPGGVFVNITNQNAAAAKALHEAEEGKPVPELPEPVQTRPYIPAEDELKSFHSEMDSNRMLEAPKAERESEPVDIGGVFRDEEQECTVNPEFSND